MTIDWGNPLYAATLHRQRLFRAIWEAANTRGDPDPPSLDELPAFVGGVIGDLQDQVIKVNAEVARLRAVEKAAVAIVEEHDRLAMNLSIQSIECWTSIGFKIGDLRRAIKGE